MYSFVHLLLDKKCLELNSSSSFAIRRDRGKEREIRIFYPQELLFSVVLHLLSCTQIDFPFDYAILKYDFLDLRQKEKSPLR